MPTSPDPAGAVEAAEAAIPLVPGDDAGPPLELGVGIPSCAVAADRLSTFTRGDDVHQLLPARTTVMYPVARSDEIVSSITVARDEAEGWAFQSVGNVNRARSVAGVRDADAATTGRDPHDYYVVTVPVLGVTLLARETDDDVEVAYVLGPEARPPGTWVPAGEALAELAGDVRRRRTDPGPAAPG